MKRHVISTVIVLTILVVAWTAFGQREGGQGTSEERKKDISKFMSKMREKFENASEEERKKLRAEIRERFARSGEILYREERLKTIKAIEEQLAKLKALQMPQLEGSLQDLSEEESRKLKMQTTKVRWGQRQALQVITEKVAKLQGLSQLEGEGARYFIVSTNELKQIQDAAIKEKAKETSQLLGRLIFDRGGSRGLRYRRPGGNRPQGGQRGISQRSTDQEQ
ncbi:MAG: hypothetical protein ACYS80_12275 [Planctomycetota bacterium]|jgi:hypothetical protein